MTKWLIAKATQGTTWQVVTFHGPSGAESRGIVDIMAIRKNHRTPSRRLKRGDLFEIILIQVKGGSASWPTANDIQRLRAVAKEYRARDILLAEWKKGAQPNFYRLIASQHRPSSIDNCWKAIADAAQAFK